MKRLLASLAAAAALCAAFATSASAGLLYAPEYSNDRVSVFSSASPGGGLAPVAGSPFAAASGGLSALVVTPDGRQAVGGYLFTPGIRTYSVSDDGALAPAQPLGALGTNRVNGLAISPDGRFVYAATEDYPAGVVGGIRAFTIAADGALSQVTGSPFGTGTGFLDVALAPDGRLLFATSQAGIGRFLVGADGTLSPLGTFSAPGATWLSATPDGRFLIAVNYPAATLSVYSIAESGVLAQVGSSVPLGGASPSAPAVSADGRFAYVAESNSDTVLTVALAPDGSPAVVGTPAGFADGQIVLASADGYLYVANDGSQYGISVARIGADGAPGPFAKTALYDMGEPVRMVFRPGLGTDAQFSAKANFKPLTMVFDSRRSTAVLGSVGSADWDFGDGRTGAGVTIAHRFRKPGVYNVRLTAVDDAGCATQFVFTGQSALCRGAAGSSRTVRVDTPPWITGLSIKRGKVRFRLTEKATVSFRAERGLSGRSVGGRCVKPTAKNAKSLRCTRWVRASKSFKRRGEAGKLNTFRFDGKVGSKRLGRGRYRLSGVAIDRARTKGPAKTAYFRVR